MNEICRTAPMGALLLFGSLTGCSSGSGGGSGEAPVAATNDGRAYATIQAAIDAADVDSVIEISAGTFVEELRADKRLILRGRGVETKIRSHGSRSTSDDSSDATRAGLTIINVQGFVLEDMDFSGNPEDGIVVRQSANVRLLGVIANGNGDDGIDIRDSTDVVVGASATRPSEFVGNADRGVQIRASQQITVDGVRCSGNLGDGIRIQETVASSIDASVVTDNAESGIRVRSAAVQIRGNAIFGNREYGIRLRDASGTELTGTDFRDGNGRGNLRRD